MNAAKTRLVCFTLLIALVPLAQASEHPCASIPEAEQRLACFDAAFPSERIGTNPSASTGADASATGNLPAGTAASKEDEFGFSRAQLRKADPEAEGAPIDEIHAKVVSVHQLGRGQRLVRIDNGQAWLLTENRSRGIIHAGDAIVIRRAALGSFMLETPSGLALRARRQR